MVNYNCLAVLCSHLISPPSLYSLSVCCAMNMLDKYWNIITRKYQCLFITDIFKILLIFLADIVFLVYLECIEHIFLNLVGSNLFILCWFFAFVVTFLFAQAMYISRYPLYFFIIFIYFYFTFLFCMLCNHYQLNCRSSVTSTR